MKRILSVLLVVIMLLSVPAALAADMGIQIIGGPEVESEPVSLEDLKLEMDAEIEGWGILTLTKYEVQDMLGYYRSGKKTYQIHGATITFQGKRLITLCCMQTF